MQTHTRTQTEGGTGPSKDNYLKNWGMVSKGTQKILVGIMNSFRDHFAVLQFQGDEDGRGHAIIWDSMVSPTGLSSTFEMARQTARGLMYVLDLKGKRNVVSHERNRKQEFDQIETDIQT
jgi:hypothetical protein